MKKSPRKTSKLSGSKLKSAMSSEQEKLQDARRVMSLHGRMSAENTDLLHLKREFLEDLKGGRKSWMENIHREPEAERNRLIEQLESETGTVAAGSDEADVLRLTLNHLGVWQMPHSPPVRTPQNGKAAKIEALASSLQRSFQHLDNLASAGDREAVELLAHHSLRASKWLSEMRKKHLNQLKPAARKSIFWPVLKSRCQHFDDIGKSLNQDDAVFLRVLDVGRDHPIKGRKIDLADELGVLILDLINEIESIKAMVSLLPVPIGWRADALTLPRLAPKDKVVARWSDVLYRSLAERFSSPDTMAEKYKHLVSQKKRVGIKTTLGELRHLMKAKLKGMAGMGLHSSKDSTPSMAWCKTRTINSRRDRT